MAKVRKPNNSVYHIRRHGNIMKGEKWFVTFTTIRKKYAIYILGKRVHSMTLWNANDLDTWKCPALQQQMTRKLYATKKRQKYARFTLSIHISQRCDQHADSCSTWGT
jgi:hypothetical protein